MELRTFIAIEVPGEIRSAIREGMAPLKTLLSDSVKWVSPDNIHLTLKFLGDTPEESIRDIEAALRRATEGIPPIRAEVKGAGAFPPPPRRNPNVLWVGLECPDDLRELKERLESELAPLGFEPEQRDFSPHLTVGRVRRGAQVPRRRLVAEMERLEGITFGTMEIREIVLMKSDLRPGGAVYTSLFTAELTG